MKLSLKTRNVFIDAEAFIAANFDYTSKTFKQLMTLAKSSSIKLFLTDVTVREIEAHIRLEVEAASTAAKHFRKNARILQFIDDPPFSEILKRFDKATATACLIEQFHEFRRKALITVLPIIHSSVETVFHDYFNANPPFSLGNKKSEFPDAFAIEALKAWCSNRKEAMYAVSADSDWKSACEKSGQLIHLESPEQFLDLISRQDKELSEHAFMVLETNINEVKLKIARAFESAGFALATGDGEVESVSLSEIDIDGSLLLEASEKGASFELDAVAQYSAEIYSRNWGTELNTYEYETDYYPRRTRYNIDREAEFPAEILLKYDEKGDAQVIVCESINANREFEVRPSRRYSG